MESTVLLVGIGALAFLVGLLVGISFRVSGEPPMIGSLNFNLDDPSKEFLSLNITEDIDLDNPPVNVLFKVNLIKKKRIDVSTSQKI